MSTDVRYVLGNSEVEHRRLMMRSRIVRPWTERFFRAAGVGAGMSVLELGCGVGDVSLITAGLVGPGGRVVGLDRDRVYLARAEQRVAAEGCGDVVRLQRADLETFETDE
jgi:ubiquinone/menaquinone biosynthesis C-methylase UbiE